jgi:hypothetical protein
LQTSQGYIIRILQHFATKLWNITNFVMLFQAVMKFLSRSKFSLLRKWSIGSFTGETGSHSQAERDQDQSVGQQQLQVHLLVNVQGGRTGALNHTVKSVNFFILHFSVVAISTERAVTTRKLVFYALYIIIYSLNNINYSNAIS